MERPTSRALISTAAALTLAGTVLNFGRASAQTPPPEIVVRTNLTVTSVPSTGSVSVSGLTMCDGQSVQLGLFDAANPITQGATAYSVKTVTVEAGGTASVAVELRNQGISLQAGVLAPCVPGGGFASVQLINIPVSDPIPATPTSSVPNATVTPTPSGSAPMPPRTGSVRATGQSSHAAGTFGIVAIIVTAPLVFIIIKRRRSDQKTQ